MNREFDESLKEQAESVENEENYAFKKVLKTKNKENRRTWSVVSFCLSILSIIFFYFSWVGLICGLLSVGAALLSRKNIGYFDKLSLAGMIISIFGVVFSVCGLIFAELIFAFLF